MTSHLITVDFLSSYGTDENDQILERVYPEVWEPEVLPNYVELFDFSECDKRSDKRKCRREVREWAKKKSNLRFVTKNAINIISGMDQKYKDAELKNVGNIENPVQIAKIMKKIEEEK